MGRMYKLLIRNYRSIRDKVEVTFPKEGPLVLIGENNAGKSNIVRALELLLGESWPGNFEPEDHDFHNRDKDNSPIKIGAELTGVTHTDGRGNSRSVRRLELCYPPDGERPFCMVFKDGGKSTFVSNETRGQCLCIVVGSDRRLSYHLSYASKYTFLSKLMHRFHQTLVSDTGRVAELKEKFEGIKEVFQSVEPFTTFTEVLETQVAELCGNLEYGLGIDFSAYDPSNYFHALRVFPQQGDKVRAFEELGTGQEQILALAFAYAYARAFHGEEGGLVVVIEEPEAHLHPLAQEWVSQKVHELARKGVQVVITTHSPAFLDVMNLEGFALVRKEGQATRVIQLSKQKLAQYCQNTGAAGATAESILPFYAAASTEEILAGLFARKIVLVEGPTEAMALPIYLTRVGANAVKEGIAIIPVHGVGNLAKWWRFFTAYGIPVYVIFDNDAHEDSDGKKRGDILVALGIPKDRHTELLTSTEWIVEDRLAVLGNDFEHTMRSQFGTAYTELEEGARLRFGLSQERSKPLIARYAAERLPLEEGSKPFETLRTLAQTICRCEAPENVLEPDDNST